MTSFSLTGDENICFEYMLCTFPTCMRNCYQANEVVIARPLLAVAGLVAQAWAGACVCGPRNLICSPPCKRVGSCKLRNILVAIIFSHQQELSQHLHALHCTGIAFCIRAQHNTGLCIDPSITHRRHDSHEQELMILLPEEMNQCW